MNAVCETMCHETVIGRVKHHLITSVAALIDADQPWRIGVCKPPAGNRCSAAGPFAIGFQRCATGRAAERGNPVLREDVETPYTTDPEDDEPSP